MALSAACHRSRDGQRNTSRAQARKRRRIGSFVTQGAARCDCDDVSRLGGVRYPCRRVSPGERVSTKVSTDTNRGASKIQGLDHLRSADPLLGRKGVAACYVFSAHRHSARTQNSPSGSAFADWCRLRDSNPRPPDYKKQVQGVHKHARAR